MPHSQISSACSNVFPFEAGPAGQNRVVVVVYEPEKVSYAQLLTQFWELHNPTQGMRQGNDIGTQYRSVIYCTTPEQLAAAKSSAPCIRQN